MKCDFCKKRKAVSSFNNEKYCLPCMNYLLVLKLTELVDENRGLRNQILEMLGMDKKLTN